MTDSGLVGPQVSGIERGQRVRLPGATGIETVEAAIPRPGVGLDLFLVDASNPGGYRKESFTNQDAERIEVISEDGGADPDRVIAGLWAEWMMESARSARSTVLASVPLRPFPHQLDAVYGRMLSQPLLRFLLADEPGTGKTIMSGLWLRESQRLGRVKRCLVVCPAHLVIKWQADFERFFGGGLREVESADGPRKGPLRLRRRHVGGVIEPGRDESCGARRPPPGKHGLGRGHLRRGASDDPDR